MALNNGSLLARGFDYLDRAECSKMASMSAFTLLVLNNSALAVSPSDRIDEKTLRKLMGAEAHSHGILKTTWQAYVSGIFGCAAKLAEGDPEFVGSLADMSEDVACADLEAAFLANNVTTGGHMRDWARQEGFAPYDADKVARERKEASASKAMAAMSGVLAAFKAKSGRDSSTLPEAASAALPSALDAALAAIAAIGSQSDAEAVLVALNARLVEFSTMVAAIPAPTVGVVADDATVHPLSSLGRVTARRAA